MLTDDEILRLCGCEPSSPTALVVLSIGRAVERAARAAAFREAADVCERWADKWRPEVPVRDRYADGLSSGADELADALRARAEGQHG